MFGISEGKSKRFADLKRNIITPAIAEINQTSRLTLTATPHKIGRTVASVTIAWEEKKPDQEREAKRELDRPKVGRKARRQGTAEVPVSEFPAHGPIQYAEPWATIAKTHGNGKDINLIAGDFRAWCSSKKIALARRMLAASNRPPELIRFLTRPPAISRNRLKSSGWLYDPVAAVWHLPDDPAQWPETERLLDELEQYGIERLALPP